MFVYLCMYICAQGMQGVLKVVSRRLLVHPSIHPSIHPSSEVQNDSTEIGRTGDFLLKIPEISIKTLDESYNQ